MHLRETTKFFFYFENLQRRDELRGKHATTAKGRQVTKVENILFYFFKKFLKWETMPFFRAQAGQYECRAENGVGEPHSAVLTLQVICECFFRGPFFACFTVFYFPFLPPKKKKVG